MFKLAVFNIQHLNLNREDFFALIFFLCIKLQERLIKIQCVHISKSYHKLEHVPELSHSVHHASRNHPPTPALKNILPIFCQAAGKLSKPPFLSNSPYMFFVTPPLP